MLTPTQIDAVCRDMLEQLRARLAQGQVEYGDRSFSADPANLVDEIDEELVDIVGWAIPLRHRLAELRAEIARLDAEVELARAVRQARRDAARAAPGGASWSTSELEARMLAALRQPVRAYLGRDR